MRSLDFVFQTLRPEDCTVEPCGSRVTCKPAPTDTDEDFLVQIAADESAISRVVGLLVGAGFKWEGDTEHYQAAANEFMSWRRGDINLIVTASGDFARRHRAATSVCTRLNLMNKDDRIALFQAVLYGDTMKECVQIASTSEDLFDGL